MKSDMPGQLIIAGRLMWTLWAVGVLYAIWALSVSVAQSISGTGALATIYAVVLALVGLVIRSVLRGRKWARVVYSLLACIWILTLTLSLALEPQSTLGMISAIALVVAYGTVLGFHFHPAARSWRHEQGEPNNPLEPTR